MNRITKIAFALSLALPAAGAIANQTVTSPTAVAAAVQPFAAGALLGVRVEAVPSVLAAQLPSVVPQGQGVLVGWVEPGSPAAAASLQTFDILLSYDDQKLFSPDQLSALVAADQPGRTVTLKLVRNGQLQEVQAELGQAAPAPVMPMPWQARPFHFPRHAFPAQPEQRQETVTESFESLNVQKLDDGRYRAAIEYLDAEGTKQSHVFEGTREELHKQISQSDKLPPAARENLLNALDMRGSWPMPRFWGPLDFEQLMRTWREGGWMQY